MSEKKSQIKGIQTQQQYKYKPIWLPTKTRSGPGNRIS